MRFCFIDWQDAYFFHEFTCTLLTILLLFLHIQKVFGWGFTLGSPTFTFMRKYPNFFSTIIKFYHSNVSIVFFVIQLLLSFWLIKVIVFDFLFFSLDCSFNFSTLRRICLDLWYSVIAGCLVSDSWYFLYLSFWEFFCYWLYWSWQIFLNHSWNHCNCFSSRLYYLS